MEIKQIIIYKKKIYPFPHRPRQTNNIFFDIDQHESDWTEKGFSFSSCGYKLHFDCFNNGTYNVVYFFVVQSNFYFYFYVQHHYKSML